MSGRGANQRAPAAPIEFGLKKLDINIIKPDSILVFIGKRNSGKSFLVEDILWHKRKDIPTAVAFSPTEMANGFYKRLLPDSFVYDEFDTGAMQKLLARQVEIADNPPWSMEEGFVPTLLIILDDCMSEKKHFNDKLVRYIFLNGRHHKIFLIVNVQYCMDLPKSLRQNVDFVFCLQENARLVRENLYKTFFGVFKTYNEFEEIFEYYCNNYGCLVINNLERSRDISKQVFWYKAEKHEPWRLDAGDMWVFHDMHYTGNARSSQKFNWQAGLSPYDTVGGLGMLNVGGAGADGAGGTGGRRGINDRGAKRNFILHKYDEHGELIDEAE